MSRPPYDARNYLFTLYYDQRDQTWVAEAEGGGHMDMNADHPTSHLAALAELERKLSARCDGLPTERAALAGEGDGE
jgi:hypothetical protein